MVPCTCGPWRLIRMLQVAKNAWSYLAEETIKYINQYYLVVNIGPQEKER